MLVYFFIFFLCLTHFIIFLFWRWFIDIPQVHGATFLCQNHDVIGKDLAATCIGAYYLQDLPSIQEQCQFNMVLQRNTLSILEMTNGSSLLQILTHRLCDALQLSKQFRSRQLHYDGWQVESSTKQ